MTTFRSLTQPGQQDLFTPDPPMLPRCLYHSKTRGVADRQAEFEAWCARYGRSGCITGWGAHGWCVKYRPSEPTERCQPTALGCDTEYPNWGHNSAYPPLTCDCWETVNAMQYRGGCTGCDWEGPIRTEARGNENGAIEDAHDHAWPGWRDLPTVPRPPDGAGYVSDTPRGKASQAKFETWLAKLHEAGYTDEWLQAGGPIRTLRKPMGTRHVDKGTLWGGYDLACSWVRVDDEHPRWEIPDPPWQVPGRPAAGLLITDEVIRTYGRKHVEQFVLAGEPPLPGEAWAVAR